MSWIPNIFSTLKTWVFKKKLLKFSDRFSRDPQACFYCPEMCRFSCPVAEAEKSNAVTPRGKMTLLHLSERGFEKDAIAGSAEQYQWYLEQCTGCGRCTEFCLHEIDVASNLRNEREQNLIVLNKTLSASQNLLESCSGLSSAVLFCEPKRKQWWDQRPELLKELNVNTVIDLAFPVHAWEQGSLSSSEVRKLVAALKKVSHAWIESPELSWFFVKALKEAGLKAECRVVWQKFFSDMLSLELAPSTTFHESYYLSRLLPRVGYSIPMYERGLRAFHSGWNSMDCGGESFFTHSHETTSSLMRDRFIEDLCKDGRELKHIVCQSLSCVEHLSHCQGVKVSYWLDEVFSPESFGEKTIQ